MTATEVRRRQAEADAREASLAGALFLDALLGLQIVIAAVSAADAAVRAAAPAMEARSGETRQRLDPKGDSAVREAEAP